MPLSLTLYSDPVCPWCWIGKRRVEKAVKNLGLEAEVEWRLRSYELVPRNQEPGPVKQRLMQKYGVDEAGVAQMWERVSQQGALEGITYDFEKTYSAPTFDAHRLLKFARVSGKDRELLERMHQAHFQNGVDLSNHQSLAKLAGELGLDALEAAKALAGKSFGAEVEAETREGMMIGVRGVPFLILNDEFAVSGAQPVAVFERAINQARGGINA